jgi:cytochrome c peroxidase
MQYYKYQLLLLFLFFSAISSADIITPIEKNTSYNKSKVSLGRLLYFDKKLSKDGTISCASCHSDFGADKRAVSVGVDNKKGQIQSLSIFNAVNNYKLFWNGRADTLMEQIDGPIHTEHEMGNSIDNIENYLLSIPKYNKLFNSVYAKKPNYKLLKDAIVAFVETLVTPDSRFDQYLRGEITLSAQEHQGFKLFKYYGCASCHNGVNVGGNSMQQIGNVIDYPYVENQLDLYDITKKESDKNVFRVPSLRNISKTRPYFHDASVLNLEDAVQKMAYYNLGMVLDKKDLTAIVAFLITLEGKKPLTWKTDVK